MTQDQPHVMGHTLSSSLPNLSLNSAMEEKITALHYKEHCLHTLLQLFHSSEIFSGSKTASKALVIRFTTGGGSM